MKIEFRALLSFFFFECTKSITFKSCFVCVYVCIEHFQNMRNEIYIEFTEKSRKVGCDVLHLLDEVAVEVLFVICEVDDPCGKIKDADEVELGDLVAHRGLGRLNDLGDSVLRVLAKDFSQLICGGLLVFSDGLLVANGLHATRVVVVIGDDADELREVPAVPLADAHSEGIDVLLELVEQANALDDHVVHAVHVELDFGATVAVGKTELGLVEVLLLKVGDELAEVLSDPALDLDNKLGLVALDLAGVVDGRGELLLDDAEGLVGRDVRRKELFEVLVDETLGDGVDVLEGVLCSLEGDKAHHLHHLGELGKVTDRFLLGLGERTNVLGVGDLEECVASGVLEKDVIHFFFVCYIIRLL